MLRSTADLDLIRRGRLSPGDLHPLVRAALFPGAPPGPGLSLEDEPVGAALVPGVPPGPGLPLEGELVRVRCKGAWHEIDVRLGRLDPLAHTRPLALSIAFAVTWCVGYALFYSTFESHLRRLADG